ncbi:MAG: hypothetical protein HY259_03925 [Chloroflexi bacterium]|nr:hypothetical protein [Chloroflexota bacterium]
MNRLVVAQLISVVVGLTGCSAPPATATPVAAPTATTAAVATPTRAPSPTAVPLPTATPRLITEQIQYSGALSVEDLNILLMDIRTLSGVQDVQGNVQDLLVTYDPAQVTHQQIVEVLTKHNYTVR